MLPEFCLSRLKDSRAEELVELKARVARVTG